jgi:hypothetical protein
MKIWREIIIGANTNNDNVINQILVMKDWKSEVLNSERSDKVNNLINNSSARTSNRKRKLISMKNEDFL